MDPGYETDDSDSTIQSFRSHRHRRRSDRRRRNSSDEPYHRPSRGAYDREHGMGDDYSSSSRRKHENQEKQEKQRNEPESDSDATIELPDRFDSQGRLLPQRGDDPLADRFEDWLKGVNRIFV